MKKYIIRRVIAFIIDIFITGTITEIISIFIGKNVNGYVEFPEGFIPLIFFFSFLLIQEILFGFTIGKKIFNLKLVDDRNGAKPKFYQFIIRRLFDLIDIYLFFLGFLVLISDKKNQRLGDKFSKIRVIDCESS